MGVWLTKSDCNAEVDRQAATWLKVNTMKFACNTLLKVPWLACVWFRIQYYNCLWSDKVLKFYLHFSPYQHFIDSCHSSSLQFWWWYATFQITELRTSSIILVPQKYKILNSVFHKIVIFLSPQLCRLWDTHSLWPIRRCYFQSLDPHMRDSNKSWNSVCTILCSWNTRWWTKLISKILLNSWYCLNCFPVATAHVLSSLSG